MQRTAKSSLVAGILVFVATLTGCSTNTAEAPSVSAEKSTTINMTDEAAVAALCGAPAGNGSADTALVAFEELVASEDSGRRNDAFAAWGVNPEDNEAITATTATLKARTATPCTDVVAGAETVGIENLDGTVTNLPLFAGGEDTVVIDTTTIDGTPPLIQPTLLDGSLRFTAQTLTWDGLVQRVGDQQWYIDGVNARAAQTGFNWDDVLKFAAANKVVDDKVQGVNALAIQIFNRPDLTDEQARDEVRKYITPAEEAIMGITVNDLPIQHINNGFTNTRNIGTFGSPQMGDYFDTSKMIRVSLMPITFNEAGEAVSLDGSRGAGIFIDCGNLHWVPKAMWTCTDATCAKPVCPPGTTGTPPNCITPPPPPPVVPPWTPPTTTTPPPKTPTCPPGTTGTPPDCLTPKDWSKSPTNGWTPLEAGPLTDGKESQRQQESGETRGNVTDHPVAPDTQSGDTTPDLPTGTVVAPEATPGGDDRSDDVVDEKVTNQDEGGTNGDTCIADPDTGASNCG